MSLKYFWGRIFSTTESQALLKKSIIAGKCYWSFVTEIIIIIKLTFTKYDFKTFHDFNNKKFRTAYRLTGKEGQVYHLGQEQVLASCNS